jgi:hypothetical protein
MKNSDHATTKPKCRPAPAAPSGHAGSRVHSRHTRRQDDAHVLLKRERERGASRAAQNAIDRIAFTSRSRRGELARGPRAGPWRGVFGPLGRRTRSSRGGEAPSRKAGVAADLTRTPTRPRGEARSRWPPRSSGRPDANADAPPGRGSLTVAAAVDLTQSPARFGGRGPLAQDDRRGRERGASPEVRPRSVRHEPRFETERPSPRSRARRVERGLSTLTARG